MWRTCRIRRHNVFWHRESSRFSWDGYIQSGQILATSHDLTSKEAEVSGNPWLFTGKSRNRWNMISFGPDKMDEVVNLMRSPAIWGDVSPASWDMASIDGTVDGSEIRRENQLIWRISHYLRRVSCMSGGCLGFLPALVITVVNDGHLFETTLRIHHQISQTWYLQWLELACQMFEHQEKNLSNPPKITKHLYYLYKNDGWKTFLHGSEDFSC